MLEQIRRYKEDLKNKSPEKVSTASVDLSKNIFINPKAFKDSLRNIDSLTDQELYNMISHSYETIFSESFIKEDKENLAIITHPRFISACVYVFNTVQQIDYKVKLYCNKIIYDYNTTFRGAEYEYIRNLLFSLGRVINKDKLYTLVALGLPEEIAVNILICRYSSRKERTNIARMNYYICKQSEELMTEQMIIWIFEKLFDKISELFQVIMFYPYDETQNEDVYSIMSLSILDIIENMPYISIKNLLTDYTLAYESGAYRKQLITSNKEVINLNETYTRFSMGSLSADYPRITQAVEELKQELVYVP